MYLKSIEMHGFKSFAQTTKLEFHNGITGVVGPNGSGKSNVADAVRWVLGEQSAKQLRGSSMQDVIFAGTEGRKPLSYAYVALTLDNSDHVLPTEYEEVTIARRVYRSGETEYLLNNAPCRLKDVYEMFYDTGVGKEGYSIIGQGQVEKVISGKPKDRRELFDEAAGIVKYKKRKSAAVKKLEHEQENLVRINDIIAELERQVGPLEKQSEKAKIYLSKKEEIKKLDVNCFLLDLERIDNELSDTGKKLEIATTDYNNANAEHEKIKTEYEQMQQQIDELDATIESIKEEQNSTSLTKNNLEGQINLLTEQIHTAEMSEEHFDARMEAINTQLSEHEKNLASYEETKKASDDAMSEVAKRLEKASADYENIQAEIKRATDGIEQYQTELMELLNERATFRSRQQHFDTMLEQVQIRKAELNSRLLSKKTAEQGIKSAFDAANELLEKANERLKEFADKAAGFAEKEREWKNKRQENRKKLEELQEQYHRAASRLESLKNIAERYDGYNSPIKAVMEKKSSEKKICGVVSDLIKVDKKYETAIETALGGNIQNIVTEDEATAKKLIAHLRENRLGRATFLPLDSVDGNIKVPDEAVLNEKGVISMANELVDAEAKFSGVVKYLLGRVVVCEDADVATAVARKYKYKIHIVTIDGVYIAPGGSISGGAFKNKGNLLSRNREIEDLEAKIEELKEEIRKTKNRDEEIVTALALLEEDRAANQEALNEEKLAQNTAKINAERAKEEMENSNRAFEDLGKETADLDQQLADIDAQKLKAKQELEASENREAEIKSESEKLAATLDQQTYLEGTAQRAVSEIQMEEATVRQKTTFILENIDREQSEIARLKTEASELLAGKNSAKDDIAKKLADIETIKGTIAAGDENFAKLEERLSENQKAREEKQAQHKNFFARQDEITKEISRLDREKYRLTTAMEKLEESRTSQNSYMWNEYELTAHLAEELKDPELNDLPGMKRIIAGLKDEIRRLGDVNVNAIEEYKEVNERYTHLKTQHDDITKAEEDLRGIIEELDNGMRVQFEENFAKIQVSFNEVFRQLFGGGKGSIELVEGEDILECGIRIIAQPPGKKLQNMILLSGGEKALTAIALLFAIQNLRPSPFCLLDEIEAALDDSNVDRFAKYLNKLTKNTQFIVITHRRGTMNAADRLYGITMQEKGVSTLVSVNLIEDKLDN